MPEYINLSDAEKRLVDLVVRKYYAKVIEGTQLYSPEKCVNIYKSLKNNATSAMVNIATQNGRISDALLKSNVGMVEFITSEHIAKYLDNCFLYRQPEMYDVIREAYSFRMQAALVCTETQTISVEETENERAFR